MNVESSAIRSSCYLQTTETDINPTERRLRKLELLSRCRRLIYPETRHIVFNGVRLSNAFWDYIKNNKVQELKSLLEAEPCTHRLINEHHESYHWNQDSASYNGFFHEKKELESALCESIKKGNHLMVMLLLDHGADPNLCSERRICYRRDIYAPINYRIDQDADNPQSLIYVKTHPLHCALSYGFNNIAQDLMNIAETELQTETLSELDDEATFNDRNLEHRETPMLIAVRSMNLPMVKALIRCQGKIDRSAVKKMVNYGYYFTPLSSVFIGIFADGKIERLLIVAYLVRFGADVNHSSTMNRGGQSILHLALSGKIGLDANWVEMCELLVAVGSDTKRPNAVGITPEDIAKTIPQLRNIIEKKNMNSASLCLLVGRSIEQEIDKRRYLNSYISNLEKKLLIRNNAESLANVQNT